MPTANRIPNPCILENAAQHASRFQETCQAQHPSIPESWQHVISRILEFRITQSDDEAPDETTRDLLASDGLDLMQWRIREYGIADIARSLPDNWPTLDENGLPDFLAILRLEPDPRAVAEILREARWQLRCTPFGENLLQETARQSCEMLLEGQGLPFHDHMVAIQMGLMSSPKPRHTHEYTMSFAGLPWHRRLAHYSHERITAVDESRLGQHTGTYATGLWVSVQGPNDWAAINDQSDLLPTDIHHRVEILTCCIMAIRTPEMVCEFIERYIDENRRVAWSKLQTQYDGIIWIQEDDATATALTQFRKILGHELPEANTGVIWNTDAVTAITATDD